MLQRLSLLTKVTKMAIFIDVLWRGGCVPHLYVRYVLRDAKDSFKAVLSNSHHLGGFTNRRNGLRRAFIPRGVTRFGWASK